MFGFMFNIIESLVLGLVDIIKNAFYFALVACILFAAIYLAFGGSFESKLTNIENLVPFFKVLFAIGVLAQFADY